MAASHDLSSSSSSLTAASVVDSTPSTCASTPSTSASTLSNCPSATELEYDDAYHYRTVHHMADVVIVGAGILGSALAVTLARQSRSVLLLEKSLKKPDRIVGELLQPGGLDALRALGLGECVEDIDAILVKGYEVVYFGQPVHIPYATWPPRSGLPPRGRSFHHGRFVQRLRDAAAQEPNVTLVETTATKLVRCETTSEVLGVECLTAGKPDCYFGALMVVADGYASKFRADAAAPRSTTRAPRARSKFWGLELIDARLPRPQHGTVVLSEQAPTLLYQIGTRETRCLVDVPDGLPSASMARGGVKGHLRDEVLPTLPQEVQPAFAAALDSGRLRSMPNSWLPPTVNRTPGLALLGDALNMRHPLTGGGMTVALNDVLLLRQLLAPERIPELRDTQKITKAFREFHWRRKNLTAVINVLAQALYSLFAANGKSTTRSSWRDCRLTVD